MMKGLRRHSAVRDEEKMIPYRKSRLQSLVRVRFVTLAVILSLACQGCAAVGLTLLSTGPGVAGGNGVSYTLDSIAYKTFTASEEHLRTATVRTLRRMAMDLTDNQATESGRQLTAIAGDRTVEIELDRITAKTSRMRVTVKQGWFFKDRATATEIIVQTEQTLQDEPGYARAAK